MMKRIAVFSLLWVAATAFGNYQQDLKNTIISLHGQAHHDLIPQFQAAEVHYPPKKLALLVFKAEKVLELWASDGNDWGYIQDFDVLAASGAAGPKLRAGDHQVPEGIYHITMLNPYSKYDLSMMVNYPDAFDKLHASLDHRKHIGGDIFIHGKDVSIGCVAIGDHAIEDLFVLVYEVGVKNVEVIIAPNDLRVGPPIKARNAPKWTSYLYKKIASALKRFPIDDDEASIDA